MKMKKRLLSLLLCGAMLFSLCPQVVSAEGVRNSEQAIGGLCEQQPALSVEDVQKLINELPTAEGLAAMSREEQDAAYTDLQTAYDAYKALTDEEQQEVTGAEIFDDLFELFNGMTNTLADSGFTVEGGTNGTAYTYADGVLTVNNGANLTISMTDNTATTSDRIVIAQSATATITLDGVKIKAPQQTSAIDLSSGSKLTLILPTGTSSSLVGGTWDNTDPTSSGCAGIHVPVGAELNIQCSETDTHKCLEASCGKLSVKGEVKSAGIGGNGNEGCGTVVIDGGVVEATGNSGAGIGGGDHGSGGNVTINGGIVTATGNSGAGIGGAGSNGSGGKVTITGGIVTATGDGGAAGIGGGWHSAGGEVIITGGIVTAKLASIEGGGNGAGIGGGAGADNGTFSTIDGSTTGNAVIFASSNLAGNEIGDDDDTSGWSGVIFRGAQGFVYGNVTLTDSFTIPGGYTLTIPNGATLTIPEGVTITNNGTIDVVDDGKIEPESRVSGSGSVRRFYTVTFDANGHGTAPAETLVIKNGFITQPTAPTADGYTFGGWYKETECNTLWNFTADPVTGTMTLYAKWTRNSSGGDDDSNLTEGNTYWFDLSSVGIPGEVNTSLSGGLSWVPFTYVGSINAYSLDSSSTDNTVTAYDHSLFIADYNVTHGASWDNLNTAELIFGKTYSSGGVDYELRAPSAQSNTSSEWDVILNKASQGGETGTTGYIKNWSQGFSWGQDTQMIDNQPYQVVRGSSSANATFYFSSSSKQIGYRPVLELPADSLSDLTTVSIDLNGGSIGTTTGTVELIMKSGQNYSVPSGWELTPPDGKAFAGWKGSNGNLYSVIASIPADVTSLTALWLDKPIITKQPESATYYVGDTAEPLTVEASVASGATLGYRWFRASKDDYSDFEEIQGTIDSTTYTPTTATAGTTYYFCLVLYIDGDVGSTTIYSDPAVVTVLERTGGSGGGGTSYDYFTITASAGAGGSISPCGSVSVREGGDKIFTITPDSGYRISYVLADGKRVGAVESYTFEDVQKGHTIEAVFAKENPSRGGNPFTDVDEDAWYGEAVRYVYEKGLMSGTSAAAFEPNANTTRAQMAAIFCRLDGSPAVEGRNNYTDVEYGSWYYDAVTWARQSGVMSGYGNNLFGPNDPVTRQQLAAMFCNYANYKGYDVTAAGGLSGFTDAGEISPWAQDAVKWAVGIGLMNGKGGGILDPQGTATRAEVAAMLHNFIECN